MNWNFYHSFIYYYLPHSFTCWGINILSFSSHSFLHFRWFQISFSPFLHFQFNFILYKPFLTIFISNFIGRSISLPSKSPSNWPSDGIGERERSRRPWEDISSRLIGEEGISDEIIDNRDGSIEDIFLRIERGCCNAAVDGLSILNRRENKFNL